MKLIHSAASPFVRKVRVLIKELGIEDKVEIVDVATTALATDPTVKAANPLGKIPALVTDDGKAIYDSRVICRYLNDAHGGDFYPEDAIWDVLVLEALIDGVMEAGVAISYENRLRPEEKQFEEWKDAQWGKAISALQHIEASHMDTLNGAVTMPVLGTACALGYLDFRHDARDWRASAPKLTAWYSEFSQRESLQSTKP